MSEEIEIREGTIAMVHSTDIVINDVCYPNTFREDIRIDRTVLEDEFANQSERFAYWSTLAALAKDQESRLKRISELVYAQADHEARSEAMRLMEEDPKRKFTEKMYETMAKTNQRYQRAQIAHLDAKKLSDVLKVAADAFSQRKEMLISLGAHARIGATDVRVMGDHLRSNAQRDEEIIDEVVDMGSIENEIEEVTTNRRRQPKTQK